MLLEPTRRESSEHSGWAAVGRHAGKDTEKSKRSCSCSEALWLNEESVGDDMTDATFKDAVT